MPSQENSVMASAQAAPVVGLSGYLCIEQQNEVAAIMKTNLEGERLGLSNLERVKIPAAGGRFWEVEGINGPESVQAITGVIVHDERVRSYWEVSVEDGGGDNPPDCFSNDLITGHGNPGGNCDDCPFGKFSENDKAPECREGRVLYIQTKESILPLVLRLAPTSLKNYVNYKVRLSSRLVKLTDIETVITLASDKNKSGVAFSRCEFKAGAKASPEQRTILARQGESVQAMLSARPNPALGSGEEKAALPDSSAETTPTLATAAESAPLSSDVGI